MDECIEKNKDKKDPGAYCASIVDRVKGTTEWREGPKSSSESWYKKSQKEINRSRSVYNPENGTYVDIDKLNVRGLEDLKMIIQEPEDLEKIDQEIIQREVVRREMIRDLKREETPDSPFESDTSM